MTINRWVRVGKHNALAQWTREKRRIVSKETNEGLREPRQSYTKAQARAACTRRSGRERESARETDVLGTISITVIRARPIV